MRQWGCWHIGVVFKSLKVGGFNHQFEKYFISSNWIEFPQQIGMNNSKKIFELPPPPKTCSNYIPIYPKFIRSNYGGPNVTPFEYFTTLRFFGRIPTTSRVEATSVAQWCPSTLDLQSLAATEDGVFKQRWHVDFRRFLGVWGRKKTHQKGKTNVPKTKVDFLVGEIGELENSWRFSTLKYWGP